VASPAAKRLLREHNLNLAEVAAFLGKREGRIGEEEVQRYLAGQAAPAAPSNGQEGDSLLPYSGLRQVIGERMSRSLREMAQLTLSSEADVTELVAQRESLRAQGQSLSYTALIARAVALTLPRHPSLNARLEEANIRLCRDLNLGIAVDLPEGLLVPVIRNAGALSAAELTARIEQLSQQTRQGQLGVEDSAGGTFTISNLGAFEVDVFTPIINPPQAAILGVGRIADRAGVVGGQLAPRKMLWLSLSFDHRLLDGGPAAAFLKEVRQRLEQPEELFK
jgi:pyruvate dehydrogenase E2 component (dihydrolipoamide acetyltransferase)